MAKISFKLKWSDPVTIMTGSGERMLSTAEANDDFWRAWNSNSDSLREMGISPKKVGNDWFVNWWRPVSAEEVARAVSDSRATDSDIDIPVPEGLSYLPFQRGGIAYINKRRNAFVADDMGLGKTIQALGAINIDDSIEKVLVACPASLLINWKREADKWLVRDHDVVIIENGKEWKRPNRAASVKVTIISYTLLQSHALMIRGGRWDMIIADECHHLKSPKAICSRALFGGGNGRGKPATPPVPARRFLALTGTPIPNKIIEIFAIINRLAPERFGNRYFFGQRYCGGDRGFAGKLDMNGASNLGELQQVLRSTVMLRRKKDDVLKDLPSKVTQVIEIPPSSAMKRSLDEEKRIWMMHEETVAKLRLSKEIAEMNDDEDGFREAARSLKESIKVVFSEMSKIRAKLAKQKVPYVCQHLRDALASVDKIVIMCHHHSMMDGIELDMEKSKVKTVRLDGTLTVTERQKAVDEFQKGDARVFIGGIKPAGVGWTLTAASTLLFAEQDWTPGNMDQAGDRIHRIGQEESCLLQHLIMQDSLDSKMINRTVDKKENIELALDINCPPPMSEDDIEEPPESIEVEIKQKKRTPYREIGKGLNIDQIEITRECLKHVASFDSDKATVANNMGFNKLDSDIGHELAASEDWSHGQAGFAYHLAKKYRKQLPDKWLSILDVER